MSLIPGALLLLATAQAAPTGIRFWDEQRKGANCQSASPLGADYWRAAADAGIAFVRVLPGEWPHAQRDFLLGSADAFAQIDEADLATLKRSLDAAHEAGVRVVLTMTSLPGARGKHLDGDRDDGRLWRDESYQRQAASFWTQLAARLRGHPAIVAYTPLNEPHPERGFGFEDGSESGYAAWRAAARGTPADLDGFNRRLVAAIRASDAEVPILLDGAFYASVEGLAAMEPVADANVLYAFHFYDPWEYTTYRVNRSRFAYPARMPSPSGRWDASDMRRDAARVAEWAKRHAIQMNRIVAAEIGVDRRVGGAAAYLEDLVRVLNEHGWHWAFYAFRGAGEWTGLDYELGTAPIDPRIWGAEARGEDPEKYKKRVDNPLWRLLQREMAGQDRPR